MKSRAALASVAMAAVALVAFMLSSCTSPEDRFCGRLREDFKLSELNEAIAQRDQRRITEGLGVLRELQDDAPIEIADDFRDLVDGTVGVVRAVTRAPGPDGEKLPVDVDEVNKLLQNIGPAAQHVSSYAEKNCGFSLSS